MVSFYFNVAAGGVHICLSAANGINQHRAVRS
jgi:hypothetical protein